MKNTHLLLIALAVVLWPASSAVAVRWCDDYIEAWHYDANWNCVGYTFVHNHVVERHWGTSNAPNHYIDSWTVCGKKRIQATPSDPTPPEIWVMSPLEQAYLATDLLAIDAGAEDPESGLQQFRLSIDGISVAPGDEVALSELGNGLHVFTAFAVNRIGLYELVIVPFVVEPSPLDEDVTPPEIACSASPSLLWPPNGRWVPISLQVAVTDDVDLAPSWRIDGVTTNDPGPVDLEALGDLVRIGPDGHSLWLRAERTHHRTAPRVYAITVLGADQSGNTATCTTTVTVPRCRR